MYTQDVHTQMCCYLSPALLAEWPGSFTSYSGNMWVQQIPKLERQTQETDDHFCYRNTEGAFSHTRSLVLEGLITSTTSGATDAGIQAEVETLHACHETSQDLSKDAIETLNGCSECTNSSMFFVGWQLTWCCSGRDLQLHQLLLQRMSWNQGSETLLQFQAMGD